MEERDLNNNVEYRIECYSGRGKDRLLLLKRDNSTGKIYVIAYHGKEPYRDEDGHAWREADYHEKAFYGLDDDFVRISNEEAEALMKEQEETGKTEWYCPILYIPDEGRPDTTLDFDPVAYEKTIDITEEEAEEIVREWELGDLECAQKAYALHGENAGEMADDIGRLYEEKDDFQNAFRWYRKSAEEDWDWGMFHLAGCYATGVGVSQDVEKAIAWYRKAYEKQGDAAGEAANEIGRIYADLPQYEKEAAEWFRRGADLGSDWAMNNLGLMYRLGKGVEQSADDALEWYEKAYERMGEAAGEAANNIGTVFQNVFEDYEEAVSWYREGATWYCDWAMFNLGTMYKHGLGVAKNPEKALEWFLEAYDKAEGAAGDAADEIGGIYAVFRQDDKEAVEWYRRGAELGSNLAMFDLGRMYEKGNGVETNREKALAWYRKVYEEQGNLAEKAADAIRRLGEDV